MMREGSAWFYEHIRRYDWDDVRQNASVLCKRMHHHRGHVHLKYNLDILNET